MLMVLIYPEGLERSARISILYMLGVFCSMVDPKRTIQSVFLQCLRYLMAS